MMHSIRRKILYVFIALILCMSIVVSVVFVRSITTYYYEDFMETIGGRALSGDVVRSLTEASLSADPIGNMEDLLTLYSGRLGIDSYRNFYILDPNGTCLFASDGYTGDMPYTENLLKAMNGEVGNTISYSSDLLDYALPIKTGQKVAYIIYIGDDKTELHATVRNMINTIFYSLILSILISVLLAVFLSRAITAPLAGLERQAFEMASGRFSKPIEPHGNDEIARLTLTFNDMADQLQNTLRAVSTEKNKIETILEHLSDGVLAFDTLGNPLHINGAARKLLRLSDNEAPTFDALFHRFDADISLPALLTTGDSETTELKITTDSSVFNAYFAVFSDENSSISGIVAALQDVTEWERLDASRREFVANVSHELRTPLSTIKSYTETLSDMQEDNETAMRFLQTIDRETDRMTRMVKDLLTLSSLSDGGELKYERFPLPALLSSVAEKLSAQFERKNQTLSCRFPEDMPMLRADRDRIEQVVTNLLTNAHKYSPEGATVRLSCDVEQEYAAICVADTGIGISEADLPHIFDRFYRVDKARSRKAGGTGLGLAIAKEITEAHGGTVNIESKEGEGTKITVYLPFSPSEPKTQPNC